MCDKKEEKEDIYAIWRGNPFLRYNKLTKKYEIIVIEGVFRYDYTGEDMKEFYSNEIVLDDEADEKIVFAYKLKGHTEPDYPENPE